MEIVKDIVIQLSRTIQIEKIDDTDFCFYQDTITQGDELTVTTGITSYSNIESTTGLNKINNHISVPKMYKGEAVIVGISKLNFDNMLAGYKRITEVITPITNINQLKDHILVLWNTGSHKICNLNYEFISIPISLGYCDGQITNEYYDLDKLFAKLKNDPHVLMKDDLKISEIPYYNATTYSNRSIEFKYLMDTEEYRKTTTLDWYTSRQYIMSKLIQADDCKWNM